MNRNICIKNSFFYLRNKSVNEWLTVFCLTIYVSSCFFEYTLFFYDGYNPSGLFLFVLKCMRYFSYMLCIFKIIYNGIIKNKLIFYICVLSVVVIINYFVIRDKTLVFLLLMMLLCLDVRIEQIIKVHFFTTMVLLCMTVIFSQIGLLNDIVSAGERTRHYLGFFWTTTGPILFLFLTLEFYYLNKGKISFFCFLFINLIAYYFYYMTNTRMAFAMTVFSSCFFFIYERFRLNYIIERFKNIWVFSPFLTAFVAVICHWLYNPNNHVWYRINEIMSGRLSLGKKAIEKYGVHFFGCNIKWVGFQLDGSLNGTYNYVDSSYLQILLQFGLIPLLIILLGYSLLIKKAFERNEFYFIVVIMIILLFSMTEPRLINSVFNIFALLLFKGLESEDVYIMKKIRVIQYRIADLYY